MIISKCIRVVKPIIVLSAILAMITAFSIYGATAQTKTAASKPDKANNPGYIYIEFLKQINTQPQSTQTTKFSLNYNKGATITKTTIASKATTWAFGVASGNEDYVARRATSIKTSNKDPNGSDAGNGYYEMYLPMKVRTPVGYHFWGYNTNKSDAMQKELDHTGASDKNSSNAHTLTAAKISSTGDAWSDFSLAMRTAEPHITSAKSTNGKYYYLSSIVYTIKFESNDYTVNFNANGGSGSMSSQSMKYDLQKALNSNTFTRKGYTFKGWATSAGGGVTYSNGASVKNLTSTNNGTVNLYAVWEPKSYKLNLYTNGGTILNGSSHEYVNLRYDTGDYYAIEWLNPTRAGYTFDGWYTSDGTKVYGANGYCANDGKYWKDNKYIYDEDCNVSAKWTPNTYKVRFNGNGADQTGTKTQTFTYDKSGTLTPNTFTKGSYTFKGWATSAGGSVAYKDGASVKNLTATNNGTVDLYAVWELSPYTIKYRASGGEGEMDTQTGYRGKSVTLKENAFTNEDYIFTGWNTQRDGTGQSYTDKVTVNQNLIPNTDSPLTTTSNTWNPDNGTKGIWQIETNTEVVDISEPPVEGVEKGFIANGSIAIDYLFDASKTYTFSAYVKGNGTAYIEAGDPEIGTASDTTTEVSGDGWKRISLSFAGSNTSVLAVRLSDGMTICGMKLEEGDTATPWIKDGSSGKLNLFAQWKDAKYTIHYDANGGEGKMDDQKMSRTREAMLSKSAFILNGKVFKEWNTAKDGSGTSYKDEQSVTDIQGSTKEVTLYAQWTDGKFKLDGETDVTNSEFVHFTADENGNYTLHTTLRDAQFFKVMGLGKGVTYDITEKAAKKYQPSFAVIQGKEYADTKKGEEKENTALSTGTEKIQGNMGYLFTNTRNMPQGYNLSVSKKLAGDRITDADKDKTFTFRYYINGLDPEFTYDLTVGDSNTKLTPKKDSSVTDTDKSGYVEGTLTLKGGETANFANIPEGAKYNITEKFSDGFEFKPRYEVTDGVETVNSEAESGKNHTSGLSINMSGEKISGYGVETMGNSDVSYEFTNTKADKHNLTLTKEKSDDIPADEKFIFTAHFSGLAENTTYHADNTKYNFTTDKTGEADVEITLKAGESVTFSDLDGSLVYDITEGGSDYVAKVKILDSKGNTILTNSGKYGKGVSVANDSERDDETGDVGFKENQTVSFNNSKVYSHKLTVEKKVSTDNPSDSDTFTVTARFSKLLKDHSYTVDLVGQDEDGNETRKTNTFTTNADGEATYTMTVSDRTVYEFDSLNDGCEYTLTENGAKGYVPSYHVEDGTVTKEKDEGFVGQPLSTTETLKDDTYFVFTNTHTIPDPTKDVSDNDNVTYTGTGAESHVMENTVPKQTSPWEYTIKQEIEAGFTEFEVYDTLPANVETTYDSMRISFKSGLSTYNGTLQKTTDSDGDTYYQNDQFKVVYDYGSIYIALKDSAADTFKKGGTFEFTFTARVKDGASMDDFKSANELTKDRSHLMFKNTASTVLNDDITRQTGTTTTYIPLKEKSGLTVAKRVSGTFGDRDKAFEYTAHFEGLDANKTYRIGKPAYVEVVGSYDGSRVNFTATDESGEKIKNIDVYVYELTESKEKGDLYAKGTTDDDGKVSLKIPDGEYLYRMVMDTEEVSDYFTLATDENMDDNSASQTYTADGLESVVLEKPEYDSSKKFTADASGRADVSFKLKADESVTFSDLKEGATYEITELPSNHVASYKNGTSQAANTQENTAITNSGKLSGDATAVFTNTRNVTDLKLVKKDGETKNVLAGAKFRLLGGTTDMTDTTDADGVIRFNGIPKGEYILTEVKAPEGYKQDTTEHKIVVGDDGISCASLEVNGSTLTDYNYPNTKKKSFSLKKTDDSYNPVKGAEFTLYDSEHKEVAKVTSADDGTVTFSGLDDGKYFLKETKAPDGYSADEKEYTADVSDNTTIDGLKKVGDSYRVVNKVPPLDLIISKNVKGSLGDRSKEFKFTVYFTGLKAGETYHYGDKTFTAPESGERFVTVYLKDDESVKFEKLPVGATYKVTEASSDHVASYRLKSKEDSVVFVKAEDTKGVKGALSTATETADANDGTVEVSFTNTRDIITVSGIPKQMTPILIGTLILLQIMALGAIVRKLRKGRRW